MKSNKKSIVTALMVAMFLAAVEGTVVTTAVPTIARELHGYDIISFVFSAYLLTSAVSTPIYGKLSDMYGRKNVLSIGILIFIAGSFLCGLSPTMSLLIAFRAVQGLGAGAIFTVTYTIIGDIFTLEERPKVQGSLNAVWGIASLAGPFLGGFLIDTLSWHWVFFINLPFGVLCVILLQRNLREGFERKKHQIDVTGAALLSAAMLIFLNMFLSNESFGLSRTVFITLSACATVLLLIGFYAAERKAAEPIIPFDIFTRTNVLANVISFLAAAVLIGVDLYMPIYIQNILGYSATISGLSLAPASVAWLISSVVLGKCILKIGGKAVILLSNVVLLASTVLLIFLNTGSSLWLVIIQSLLLGFGMGGAYTTLTIVVQSSVRYQKRGAATASNTLLKTLGQTIGVSIFGGFFNLFVGRYLADHGITGVDPGSMFTASSANGSLSVEQMRLSFCSAIHDVFVILIALAILCILLTILMPKVVLFNPDDAADTSAADASALQ